MTVKTIVRVRLVRGADGEVDRDADFIVTDLMTGQTKLMTDPGVLAQIEPGVSEAYFDAWLANGDFSFGNRVPPPED